MFTSTPAHSGVAAAAAAALEVPVTTASQSIFSLIVWSHELDSAAAKKRIDNDSGKTTKAEAAPFIDMHAYHVRNNNTQKRTHKREVYIN